MHGPSQPHAGHSVGEVVRGAARELAAAGIDTARLDAELLVRHALHLSQVELHTRSADPLDEAQVAQVSALVHRRVAHEPVQYITGRAYFRNLELFVDRRVLIPRPETELLVEWALEEVARRAAPTRVLDVCTGSGAIAVAIADEAAPGAVEVAATDISTDALHVARINVRRAEMAVDVELLAGDLYEPVAGRRFDVVVSNPPYVAASEHADLPRSVAGYEPHVALFSPGDDGTELVRGVVTGAVAVLAPGGLLAIEVGMGQHELAATIFREAGFTGLEQRRDLQGIVRAVGGRAPC